MSKLDHSKFNHYEGLLEAYHMLWHSKEQIESVLNGRYTTLESSEKETLQEACHHLSDVLAILNQRRLKYRAEFYRTEGSEE